LSSNTTPATGNISTSTSQASLEEVLPTTLPSALDLEKSDAVAKMQHADKKSATLSDTTPKQSASTSGTSSRSTKILQACLPSRVIALDLETSGLSSQYDSILQIGMVEMEAGEIISAPFYEKLVPSEKMKISIEALSKQCDLSGDKQTIAEKVGRYFANLQDGITGMQAGNKLASWLDGKSHLPVVAHNAAFDLGFMVQFFFQQRRSLGVCGFGYQVFCTMQMAKQVIRKGTQFNLDAVADILGLPPRPANHDALQDAILCGNSYFLMKELIELGEVVQ
jgi:DNA polymerase III epsilon subunit-like protein